VIGGEVVHEVDHVALEVVGVAEKYKFHFFYLLLIVVSAQNSFLTTACHFFRSSKIGFSEPFVPVECKFFVKS
jgi:hypothetical protein